MAPADEESHSPGTRQWLRVHRILESVAAFGPQMQDYSRVATLTLHGYILSGSVLGLGQIRWKSFLPPALPHKEKRLREYSAPLP
jgi:hypothetical protein